MEYNSYNCNNWSDLSQVQKKSLATGSRPQNKFFIPTAKIEQAGNERQDSLAKTGSSGSLNIQANRWNTSGSPRGRTNTQSQSNMCRDRTQT